MQWEQTEDGTKHPLWYRILDNYFIFAAFGAMILVSTLIKKTNKPTYKQRTQQYQTFRGHLNR